MMNHNTKLTKIFENEKLWCHAKNIPALEQLKKIGSTYFGIKRRMLQLHQMVFLDLSWERLTRIVYVLPEKSEYKSRFKFMCWYVLIL